MEKNSNERKFYKQTFLLGALVGAISFLLIYGWKVLIFTNVDWLRHSNDLEGLWDLSQHYLGWVMYRNSPWTFPFGMLEGLSPEPLSIVYTDSIPLFAVIFKILSPMLPTDFQYFGIFEFLTYILVGGFGALIPAKYGKSKMLCTVSGLLFVLTPVLTKRVFYHSALSAHFLILMAIVLWLYKDKFSTIKYEMLWILLLILSTTINAYYIPMVLAVLLVDFISCLLEKKKAFYHVCYVVLGGVFSLTVGWLLGMFEGDVSSSAENIENVSFNLLGFINPKNELLSHVREMPLYEFTDEQSYSLFFKGFDVFTPWQNEGFSYLGLGLIVGCIIIFIIALKKKWMKKTYVISIGISMVIFLLLALGPRGTIGTVKIYEIHWPATIYNLLSVFRTAGRLIWPVYYGLISLCVVGFAKWWEKSEKKKYVLILLCGITALQFLDTLPSLMYKHEIYSNISEDEYDNELDREEGFAYLGEVCDEIIFVAPTAAIRLRPYWSTVFEDYAIQNNLCMNAAYCSRDTTSMADAYANENIERRQAGEVFENVIYVFLTEDILKENLDLGLNIYCYEDIYIGSDLDLSEFMVEY